MTDSTRPIAHPDGPLADLDCALSEPQSSGIDLKPDSTGETRVMAILEEARRAPLPSTPGTDAAELSRARVPHLAKMIRGVPEMQARRRRHRRALFAGLSAAAAATLFVGLLELGLDSPAVTAGARDVPALVNADEETATRSGDPVAETALDLESEPVVTLRQVFGKVIRTRKDGGDVLVRPEMGLDDGDEISTTAEAFASVEFGAGVRIDLSSATTLRVSDEEKFDLRAGRVDINVPRLPGERARRIEVNTPNAQVVVRGTIFSVEVDFRHEVAVTRVGVTRGAVSVFSGDEQHLIRAGENWSSDEEEATKPQLERRRARILPRTHAVDERAEVAPNTEDGTESAQSTKSSLSRQNRLFARGLRARDQKDDNRAVYWFGQLLNRHPDSPLAEAALRERDAARERLLDR